MAVFDSKKKDYHTLHVIPKYGHLDIFMGEIAAEEVYPIVNRRPGPVTIGPQPE